jgi:hypothetical protein
MVNTNVDLGFGELFECEYDTSAPKFNFVYQSNRGQRHIQ